MEQEHLVLHEQKKPVKFALWPGPSNPKDANAIAIDMNNGTRRIHVGYIASELCKYLHPLITGDIVDASAQYILFRVEFRNYDNKAWWFGDNGVKKEGKCPSIDINDWCVKEYSLGFSKFY